VGSGSACWSGLLPAVAFHAAVDLKGFQLPTVKKPLYPCRAACSISLLLSLAVFKARLDGALSTLV